MNPTSLQNGFVSPTDLDGVPPTETQTDIMDLRSFYTPKTKTETKEETLTISFTLPLASLAEATNTSPEWLIEHQADLSDYIRGYWVFEDDLDDGNLAMLTQAVEEVKRVGVATKPKTKTKEETTPTKLEEAYLDEAYRQGFKDAKEESDLLGGWKFEPTLHDIANHHPTMRKEVDQVVLYRHPTETELNTVIWAGELFRFPIAYTWDGIEYTTYRAVLTGKTWTLGEFLERAQIIYSCARGKHLKAMGDHVFFEGFIGDTFHCGS